MKTRFVLLLCLAGSLLGHAAVLFDVTSSGPGEITYSARPDAFVSPSVGIQPNIVFEALVDPNTTPVQAPGPIGSLSTNVFDSPTLFFYASDISTVFAIDIGVAEAYSVTGNANLRFIGDFYDPASFNTLFPQFNLDPSGTSRFMGSQSITYSQEAEFLGGTGQPGDPEIWAYFTPTLLPGPSTGDISVGGNVIGQWQTVPEPSAIALLLLGFGALIGRRIRKL